MTRHHLFAALASAIAFLSGEVAWAQPNPNKPIRMVTSSPGGGADFAALARERSIDPSAAQTDGDLGFFRRETMIEPFAEAAFSLGRIRGSRDTTE